MFGGKGCAKSKSDRAQAYLHSSRLSKRLPPEESASGYCKEARKEDMDGSVWTFLQASDN